LKSQVRQLQNDNLLLESKLKESFSAQPAAMDPRELTKAQGKVQSLQKENELLKFSLTQEKSKSARTVDPRAVEQTQQFLNEANRKLVDQIERANKLALEKTALQNKLAGMGPGSLNATALAETKKSLEEANAKLAQQSALAEKLTSEKEALLAQLKAATSGAQAAAANAKLAEQSDLSARLAKEKESLLAQVNALSASGSEAAALRAENQLLKKQLSDLTAASSAQAQAPDAARKLALAQAEIAALQSDKDVLRLEKVALENRFKQASARTVTSTVIPKSEDLARIKQLEQERDELQRKLLAANKEASGRNGQAAGARISEMENQLAILRARTQVFESRQVPYTAEELALFKRPEAKLASTDPHAGRKSVKELPPESARLVAAAQRYFAAGQFDKAEVEYLQVLHHDQNNGPVLANLALIQIELNRLADAEKNIKRALIVAPDDSYNLLILGHLKFRQEKYDDAINALSRGAGLDPQDAQIQNFLGMSLCEKGLRGPGETALRKAIQLQPGYAEAHNNLAVVYITQQPPAVELARWHYQKALAGGHPHNPDLEKMLNVKATASK
jgi:Tfp pilus assembly protein PilF